MRLSSRSTGLVSALCILFLLTALAVAGCEGLGGGGDDGTSSTASTESGVLPPTTSPGDTVPSTVEETTTTTVPTPATTATTLASTEEKLPNGNIRSMGFIKDVWVDGSGRHMSIDYASMLTGAAADAAAVAAGEILPGEHVPNDYFIENVSPKLRQWKISNAVVITTDTRWAPHDGFGASCSWADFLTFWGPGPLPDGDSQLHAVPWWIERDGDTVVKIEEQYIP